MAGLWAALNVSLALPPMPVAPGMSGPAAAKFALLASLSMNLKAMGMLSLNAGTAAGLKAMILSLNANLPPVLGAVPPAMPAMRAAGMLGAVMAGVQAQFGINLASPGGAAALQAKLNLAAKLGALAAAPVAPPMPAFPGMSAAAALSIAAALGLPVLPANALSLVAALSASFAGMKLPPVTAPVMSALGTLGAVANIQAGLGVNMLLPGAGAALAGVVAKIDLAAVAGLSFPAAAKAPIPAVPAVAINAGFAAKLDASLKPASLGALAPVVSMAALAVVLKMQGIPLVVTPCKACAFLKAAI